MLRPSQNQGRLPESMSLSLGLHALLLLIPLGALIQSEGEVEGRTRVQLIDLADKDGPNEGDRKTQPSLEDLLKLHSDGAENEALVSPENNPNDDPLLKDSTSALDPIGQSSEVLETTDSQQAQLNESQQAVAVSEASTLKETGQEAELTAEAGPPKEDSHPPKEENLPELKPTTELQAPSIPTETTLHEPITQPAPKPEEVVEEKEERTEPETPPSPREFARAPSRGPESDPPPNTARISDQNMSVEEEFRAAVHSTEEGSAELGVTGSTASSGRPAPPGSQPAGRQGQSGDDERNGRELSPDPTNKEQPGQANATTGASNSEGSTQSRRTDDEHSVGSAGWSAQPGSVPGREAAAASPGQEGFRVPQAADGDIAALLAARRGTQGQAGLESRSQAGAPYRPSLAIPGSAKNGNQSEATGADQAGDQINDSQTASGDGLAEVGDRDGLHPEAAEYRRGAPSGGASIASPGASDRSATAPLTVADLSIQLGDVTRLNARATPLGVYISTIEDEIRKAWVLPVEYRAMGTQGVAEVSFIVSRNGRVSQARIVRKSGTDGLDRLALQSIPRWLPRIPKEIDRRQIQFSYVFRATDSIVSDTVTSE